MKCFRAIFLASALGTLVLVGCKKSVPEPPADLVAKIGQREIRAAEVQEWMKRRYVGNEATQKQALLQEMFDSIAQLEKARELGLDRDPELRRSWENMLVAKLREQQLEPRLTNAIPSGAQIKEFYEANLADYSEPEIRQGAILYADTPARMDPERKAQSRKRLEEGRAKALQPAPDAAPQRGFGKLAVDYSEDQITRYRGGDIGWLSAGRPDSRFDRAVGDALFALAKPGDISEIIETARGFYVVKFLDLRPKTSKPLAAVQEAIRHKLMIRSNEVVTADWKKQVRMSFPVVIYTNALDRVQSPIADTSKTNFPPVLP